MKYSVLIPLVLLLAAPTYYEGQNITVGRMEFSTFVAANDQSVALTSEYFTLILRLNRCEVRDAYRFCLRNLTRDYAEFYPHEVQIVLDVENVCGSDCVALGYSCERDSQCASNYCVHGTCRNQRTWCGDGVCDPQEEGVCLEDCPLEESEPVQEQEVTAAPDEEVAVQEEQEEEVVEETVSQQEELLAPHDELSDEELISEQRRILGLVSEQEVRQAVRTARSDINWPAALGIVAVGALLLFLVFRRHRHATI